MNNWRLCVPTLKRKNPLILEMLDKDPTLTIYLCCRHEEIESGFYDDLSKKSRVVIVDLGSGLTELGETRQRILEYCKKENVDYCCMFDDGIYNVCYDSKYDKTDLESFSGNLSISNLFNVCINLMTHDELSDYIIGFTFTKREYIDPRTGEKRRRRNKDVNVDDHYFLVHAGQAIMIDIKKAFKYNLSYKNMNICGFEDAAFEGDAIKAGLIWAGRKWIMIDGVVPNAPKEGGSHHDNFKLEEKYDRCNKICYEYLNMMGIYIRKKYEDYCSSYVSFIIWDFDYFRDVLCTSRKQNSKVIKSRFKLL